MLKSTLYNIYNRTKAIHSSFLSYYENIENITIGEGTTIDALSSLKGGVHKGCYLKIGKSVKIKRNCYISATEGIIVIGDDVLIAHNSWIAGHGKTFIGANTLIGPNVVIVSSNHDLSSGIYPAVSAPEIFGEVNIGSGCWIGANATIVPNVNIGNNCIIAGGSVVTKDIKEGTLIAGNPAKPVKRIMNDIAHPYKVAN